MPEFDVVQPLSVTKIHGDSKKDLLRFSFQGYAVWLEAEQFPSFIDPASPHNSVIQNDDLDQVIRTASQELDVFPIPIPHMTMLYGISHLPEREVRKRFQSLALQLQEENWPILQPEGFLSDIEISGLNGGEMNMAWIETSFKTSEEFERLIDLSFESFYGETSRTRNGLWCPHISLAYDNEEWPIPSDYLHSLISRFPTLTLPRRVESVSLWDLNGTIDQWQLMDRFPLRFKGSSLILEK